MKNPKNDSKSKFTLKWNYIPTVKPSQPGGGGGGRSSNSESSVKSKTGPKLRETMRDVFTTVKNSVKQGIGTLVSGVIKHPLESLAASQGALALMATSSRPLVKAAGKFGLKLIPTVLKAGSKVVSGVAGKLNMALSPWPKVTKLLPTVVMGLLATATTADVINITIDQVKAIQGNQEARARLDQFVPGFMRGTETLKEASADGRAASELGKYIMQVMTGKYTRNKISSKLGG